jgi:hypothetical protein
MRTVDVFHVNRSAHFVRWVTRNNRPTSIVEDQDLRELLMAGRPSLVIPSPATISRDIKASFNKCREHVARLLQVRQFMFDVTFVANLYHCDRNIPDAYTLPPMLGRLQITGPLLLGQYILSMKEQ